MRPLTGSGVAAVMPASARAFELAQLEWPSAELRKAGRSDTIASRVSFFGFASGNAGRAQPPPMSQGFLSVAAQVRTFARIASWVTSSLMSHWPRAKPPLTGWMWLSWKAGSPRRPPSGTTRVFGPTSARAPASVPT